MIDAAHRRHQRIRYIDETVQLPGYDSRMRQVAVAGLGRKQPTLFLSNNVRESARLLIVRYAGRNRVEDALGISINFFHLDYLASEVRLNVDLDATLTVWSLWLFPINLRPLPASACGDDGAPAAMMLAQ